MPSDAPAAAPPTGSAAAPPTPAPAPATQAPVTPAGPAPQAGAAPVSNQAPPAAQAKATPSQPTEWVPQVPQGVTLDQQAVSKLRSLNLPPEMSQKVLELGLDMVGRGNQARQVAIEKQIEKWHSTIFADPDIGGEKFAESRQLAGSVLERFGSQDLKMFMQESKVGFNPAFFRFVVNVGRFLKQAVAEDSSFPVAPSASQAADKSEEARLRKHYPTMFKE